MSEDLAPGQYRDSSKLMARMSLHLKYGQADALADLPSRLGLPPGARVLEVGCGPGRFWERAAEKLPADLDLLLTDLSPGMVDEAVRRVQRVGRWRSVRGQVADVGALPFHDAAFDVVMAMHMLYHAPDPEAAVGEIARVLNPEGIAVVTTNGRDSLSALIALGHAVLGGPAVDPVHTASSLESGEPIMRRWFETVDVTRSIDVMRITDPADVIAYMLSFPAADGAGVDVRFRLEAKVRDAFDAGDGVFCVRRDTGCLIGRRPFRT